MICRKILLVLFLAFIFTTCKKEMPEYAAYREKPEYLKNIKAEDKPYYEAYNKVLDLWNVPFDELYVPTSHGKAHVILCGPEDGEPLVLLHGMNAGSVMWYPNVEALSKNHRVFAIDLFVEPGKSEPGNEAKETEDIVTWYYEIFDKLHLKDFSIIGASRGGWLSVNIALQNMDKVNIKRMVLLSPAQTFMWIQPGLGIFSNIIYEVVPKKERLRNVLENMSSDADNINQKFIDLYHLAVEKGSIDKLVLDMRPFSDEELKALSMPVLVLIGDEDIINKEKSIKTAEELIPQSESDIINDAGHFLSIDQAEIVNKKMLDFLERKVNAK